MALAALSLVALAASALPATEIAMVSARVRLLGDTDEGPASPLIVLVDLGRYSSAQVDARAADQRVAVDRSRHRTIRRRRSGVELDTMKNRIVFAVLAASALLSSCFSSRASPPTAGTDVAHRMIHGSCAIRRASAVPD